MADVAGVRSAFATAAAATADTVTLSGGGGKAAEIVNRGAAELFFRSDGTTAVAGADENEVCLAGERLSIRLPASGAISLISTDGTDYGVIVTG